MKKTQKKYIVTAGLFVLFIVYTILVATVDVQPVGPQKSNIGFATINMAMFQSLGQSQFWYTLTKYLGILAILVVLGFGVIGLIQMIRRKNFFLTDMEILVLGGFYVVMGIFYVLFEKVVVNYRPILEEGNLEASYPSSHTMLVCCFNRLIKNQTLCLLADIAAVAIIALMVMGRLLSGVHWFTDIIGGVIISAALVMLYVSVVAMLKEKIHHKASAEWGSKK